jgi:transcription initiation factor TFIID subunit 6
MKTLLLALISPGKSHGTREGAIRGLVGVGKEAVRKGLVEGGGAKVVGAEWESGEGGRSTGLVNSVMVRLAIFFFFFDLNLKFLILQDALRVLQPASDMNDSLDLSKEGDAAVFTQLNEVLGEFFAGKVSTDAAWARGVLGLLNS